MSSSIHSMTGFGSAVLELPQCRLMLQIKSVNSRFVDLTLKVPDELATHESLMRELLNQAVKRGKVECKLSWQVMPNTTETNDSINTEVVAQLLAVERAILQHAPHAAPLTVADIVRHTGVLPSSAGATQALSEVQAVDVQRLMNSALQMFVLNRAQEGAHLGTTLSDRLHKIEAIVADLRVQLPDLLIEQERKLTERLFKAIDQPNKAEVALACSALPREELMERIKHEVSLTAIRIDVAEELDRLDGHLANARQCLAQGGAVGKRLDFLMQEFNREANTLGSKSASALQTQASLEMKLMIEQMREQVQNLE